MAPVIIGEDIRLEQNLLKKYNIKE